MIPESDVTKVQAVSCQYSLILDSLGQSQPESGSICEQDLETDQDFLELEDINGQLWNLEDSIRALDRQENWGHEFIEVSKNIRRLNDQRAKVKKTIDQRFKCEFWDVKTHQDAN